MVFSMPAIPMEKVLDYSLVPTYLKSQADVVAQIQAGSGGGGDEDEDEESDNNASRATITPAILILTARTFDGDEDDDDEAGATIKHLKVVRCPAVDMANWVFEVGTLPEPKLAREFLPGASNVTVCLHFHTHYLHLM